MILNSVDSWYDTGTFTWTKPRRPRRTRSGQMHSLYHLVSQSVSPNQGEVLPVAAPKGLAPPSMWQGATGRILAAAFTLSFCVRVMPPILPHHTLLLLEDEPRVACALSHLITMIGPSIVQASSVEVAKQVFLEDRNIRWVLADYGMNGELTGLDFLAWAKQERSEVKRILISGLDIHDIHDEVEAICDDFVPKPFGIEELRAILVP